MKSKKVLFLAIAFLLTICIMLLAPCKVLAEDAMSAEFKSLLNEMYAKDISKKVRTSLKTKQLKGEYLGTTAPFGYMKNPDKKGHLIPDPISSIYVKKIFELYLSGNSLLSIPPSTIYSS